MKRIWNTVVMCLLWPLWWPLSGLYLIFSAGNSALAPVQLGKRARSAMHLFQIWLGWRD